MRDLNPTPEPNDRRTKDSPSRHQVVEMIQSGRECASSLLESDLPNRGIADLLPMFQIAEDLVGNKSIFDYNRISPPNSDPTRVAVDNLNAVEFRATEALKLALSSVLNAQESAALISKHNFLKFYASACDNLLVPALKNFLVETGDLSR